MAAENPMLLMRSAIETPVLDERKWSKLADLPVDVVLCDMEDSVPVTRKLEARPAVAKKIEENEFPDRQMWGRPNALSTEWGRDDAVALGRAGVRTMMLPKIDSPADVKEFQRIVRAEGADPDLVLTIETPGAASCVEELMKMDKVIGVTTGENDLTVAMGIPLFLPDGTVNPIVAASRYRTYLAAAANNVARWEGAFVQDIRNLEEFRARCEVLMNMGTTGILCLYPPQVHVANDVFRPTAEAVAHAHDVIAAFEAARASGAPAVQLENGRVVYIFDYLRAQQTLERAASARPAPAS